MDEIKQRLEKVLQCDLLPSDVEFVSTYYRAFYANPEDYESDGVVDLILNDLGYTRKESSGEVDSAEDIWDSLSSIMEMRGLHEYDSSIEFFKFKEGKVPGYLRIVGGECIQFLINAGEDAVRHLSDTDTIGDKECAAIIYTTKDANCVAAFCFNADAWNNGSVLIRQELAKCSFLNSQFLQVTMLSGITDPTRFLYVPCYKMSSGNIIPISWINTIELIRGSNENYLQEFDEFESDVEKEDLHKMCTILENRFPAIDSDLADTNSRYISTYHRLDICYNRNYKAYNGNVRDIDKMFTYLVGLSYSRASVDTNLYSLMRGKSEGEDFYMRLDTFRATDKSVDNVETKRNSVRLEREYYDSDAPAGKLVNDGKTVIDRILNEATGMYEIKVKEGE